MPHCLYMKEKKKKKKPLEMPNTKLDKYIGFWKLQLQYNSGN